MKQKVRSERKSLNSLSLCSSSAFYASPLCSLLKPTGSQKQRILLQKIKHLLLIQQLKQEEEQEEDMGILHDDVVIITQAEKEGDPSVITINCPDKTGLGCDLCRIILFFGLSIVRGGQLKWDVTAFACLLQLIHLLICAENMQREKG